MGKKRVAGHRTKHPNADHFLTSSSSSPGTRALPTSSIRIETLVPPFPPPSQHAARDPPGAALPNAATSVRTCKLRELVGTVCIPKRTKKREARVENIPFEA